MLPRVPVLPRGGCGRGGAGHAQELLRGRGEGAAGGAAERGAAPAAVGGRGVGRLDVDGVGRDVQAAAACEGGGEERDA